MTDLSASLRSLGLDFTREELERVKEVATPDVLRAVRRAPVVDPEREQARLIQQKYRDALQVVRSGGADGGGTQEEGPAAEHGGATVGSPPRGTPGRVFTIHEELRRRLREMINEGGLASPRRSRNSATGDAGAGGDTEAASKGSAPHYAPPSLPASSTDSRMREFEEMRREVARRVATRAGPATVVPPPPYYAARELERLRLSLQSALDKLSRRFAGREARVRAFLRHVDALRPGVVSAAALRAALQQEAVPLTSYEDGHEGEVAVEALAALVSGGIRASMFAPLASAPTSPPGPAEPPRHRHRPARGSAGHASPAHAMALATAQRGQSTARPWRPPGVHLAPTHAPQAARPASRPRSALPSRSRDRWPHPTRQVGGIFTGVEDRVPPARPAGGWESEEGHASLRAAWGLQQDIAAARPADDSVGCGGDAGAAASGLRGDGVSAATGQEHRQGSARPSQDKKRSTEPREVVLSEEALRHIKRLRSDIAAAQQRAGLSSRALFMRLDSRRQGTLGECDLLRGLRSVGVVLSRADARLLITAAGTMPEGSMTFLQFNRLGNSHLPLLPTGVDTRNAAQRPLRGRPRVRSASTTRGRPSAAAVDVRGPAKSESASRSASRGVAGEEGGRPHSRRPWTPTGRGSSAGPHVVQALPAPEPRGGEPVVAPAPIRASEAPLFDADGYGEGEAAAVEARGAEREGESRDWAGGGPEGAACPATGREGAGACSANSPAPEALSLSRIWGQEPQDVRSAPAVTPKRAQTLFNVVRSKLVGKVSSSAGASELYSLVSRRDGSQATPSGALPGTGHVTAEGLRDGLRRLGLPLTTGESAAVLGIAHPSAPEEQGVPFSSAASSTPSRWSPLRGPPLLHSHSWPPGAAIATAFVSAVAGRAYSGGQEERPPLRTGVRIVPSPQRSRPKPYATDDGGGQIPRWPAPVRGADAVGDRDGARAPPSPATPRRHRSPRPARASDTGSHGVLDAPPPGLGRDWAVAAGLSSAERAHHAKHQSVRCYLGAAPEQPSFTVQRSERN